MNKAMIKNPSTAHGRRDLLRLMWKGRYGYLFVSPFFISFAIFGLYPIIYGLLLSLYEWDGSRAPWHFVGFRNYTKLIDDYVFWITLKNSLFYWAILCPMLVSCSLVLAVMFNTGWLRGTNLFRTSAFMPYITSGFIMSLVFLSLFNDSTGWINAFLSKLGLPTPGWLYTTTYSRYPPLVVILWRNVGYYMIMMVAGLQSIGIELYEAASIDGAGGWQKFRWITLPLMRPIIIFVGIISSNMVLNMFEVVFGLTYGGPQYSSQTLMLLLYQRAFQWSNYGGGSALAVVISFITIVIAVTQIKFLRGI